MPSQPAWFHRLEEIFTLLWGFDTGYLDRLAVGRLFGVRQRRACVVEYHDRSRHAIDAKAALEKLHRELLELNPSAARSLEEGREETLTVHRLGLDDLLRCTLATTNPIESAFSVVDRVCGRVKRWRGGDQRERWVGAGLWLAEKSFRRVKGYRHLPKLLDQLGRLSPPPPAQAQAA